ncbi:hypothetical protein CCMSSC00406_0004924 [Pleurotus cornucopiae]|uniref:Uncharacterized protein n=1 Tax=Pleurotus cornucopiae TaxID=5321 RepID=A0ACB7J0C0_PLECO|nr:hypothetical protein CCMSSC00406_0004924 [Pleurotus cornucopiae]
MPIDGTQGELEFPCQYPHALDEVIIDGFLYSLLVPYPLSQAPSLYFDMSPSLNGESDIDVPVALDNLRYNLSGRSEAHSKSKIFDSAYSGTPSYPEKAGSHLEDIACETYSSSTDTAPSTASGTPVPPPYPPGAFYASSDHGIELPTIDDPSPTIETSGYDTSMYPPGAFDSEAANHLPAIATESLPHTGLSLYPPGAFSSSDHIDLPATVAEAYPEADETGSSLHPPGAFNSSDTIDRSPKNTGLQEDETESCDESVEAGDSSYDGDGSLSDSDQHDPSPTMTEAARLEEMYDYIRCLLTIEPNSDILDDDTVPASSTSRALPDFVMYTELYRPTSEPSIFPTILAGSDEGARAERDYQRNDNNDDGVDRSAIPMVDQPGLAHANEVDTLKDGSMNIHNESPSTDCSTDAMQPIATPTCAQDASPPCQEVISTPEHDPLTNKDTLEISTTTRTTQYVEEYCTSGNLSLHDLMASVHESHTRARTTSSEADHKLASSTSIADPSPWGTAPATRGVRRLTMTSPRVLLRRGASCYDLHRSTSKGLCSIANEHSDPKHSTIGHQGLLRALSTPFLNGRPENGHEGRR